MTIKQNKNNLNEISITDLKNPNKKWYRFCGEGHVFAIQDVLTDDDSRYCKYCKRDVDIYEEEAILAETSQEAAEIRLNEE